MQPIAPHRFLDDQFPTEFRHLIPSTLRTAYRHAEHLVANETILQIESAEDNKGRLISYAVDFGFVRLIETGAPPFDFSWEYFARPTGRYLAIRASHSVITISQVSDPTKQPRNAIFRENRRLNNQLFLNFPEFQDDRITGLPHLLITHGYQSLDFAHLCVPDPVHTNGYRFRTDNLLIAPHEVRSEIPPPENTDTDFDDLNLLKKDIDRWTRDHGGG